MNPHEYHKSPSKIRFLLFAMEISLIVLLLIIWFSNDAFQVSNNLWVLFFYSFPSEFLIAIVPHEPMLIYFGKSFIPLTVALVAVSSTVLAEALNYSAFKYIVDLKAFKKISSSQPKAKLVNLFNHAPFFAIWVAGFTPVPFFPFRFMVVIARYSVWKYLLAVFLSRTPRFFILALVGYSVKIPDIWLILLFAAMLVTIYIPFLVKLKFLKQKKS